MSSPVRLLIFDMDDTLVASHVTWGRAERRLYRQLGQDFAPRIAELYRGCNAWDVGRIICEQVQPQGYTPRECGRMLREYLLEEFQGRAVPMSGADDLLQRVAGRYRLAVASGSPAEAIRLVLARFGWTGCFDLVVSSEEVARGKPEPDVFLETAARAGCLPREALVIEDSLNGVLAARRAGMICFAVPASDDLRIAATADRVFASLTDIALADLDDPEACFGRSPV